MASTFALIVAAGRGSRFGGSLPKQYLRLGGTTVLRHAAAAFATHRRIAGVLVAIRPEDRKPVRPGAVRAIAASAGAGRRGTAGFVRLGLEALAAHKPDRVLIHDGARPFPDAALIDRVSRRARPGIGGDPGFAARRYDQARRGRTGSRNHRPRANCGARRRRKGFILVRSWRRTANGGTHVDR